MNFEVVDNVFQVTLLGSMAILSLIVALRRRISAALWWLWMYVTGNFVLCALSDDHR